MRQTDLGRLVKLAAAFARRRPAFVAELQRRFAPGGDGARGVHLLDLHRAKGLEFETVFLPRLEEKELPARQARTPEEIAEERRLLYVGMTRAKRTLWLSWSGTRSRFLAELGYAQRPRRAEAREERRAPGRPPASASGPGGSSARARTAFRPTSSSTTRCCTRSPTPSRARSASSRRSPVSARRARALRQRRLGRALTEPENPLDEPSCRARPDRPVTGSRGRCRKHNAGKERPALDAGEAARPDDDLPGEPETGLGPTSKFVARPCRLMFRPRRTRGRRRPGNTQEADRCRSRVSCCEKVSRPFASRVAPWEEPPPAFEELRMSVQLRCPNTTAGRASRPGRASPQPELSRAARVRRDRGCRRSRSSRTSSSRPSAEAQHYVFATLPDELGFSSRAGLVAAALARAGGVARCSDDSLPARDGRAQAGRGVQDGRPVPPIDLPGIVLASFATLCLGVVLGPEAPLIAIGSGIGVLAVHLVKKRCARDGQRRRRRCRELRRDQHAAWLAARRRVPADGGVRTRRRPDGGRARAGLARRRHRRADLRRAGLLDRFRHVLADHPEHPVVRQPRRRRVPLGRRHRSRGRRARRGDPAVGPLPAADRRAANGAVDPGRRPGGRRARGRVRRRDRAGARPRCSSPGRTSSPR